MPMMYTQLGHHPFYLLVHTRILNIWSLVCMSSWYIITSFTGCDCNAGGSKSDVCSKDNGKCPCQENIVGQKCDR